MTVQLEQDCVNRPTTCIRLVWCLSTENMHILINLKEEFYMNQKKRYLFATLFSLTLSASVAAADDHKGHDHDKKKHHTHTEGTKPLYGGVVTKVKDINYELVAKPNTIALYIHDHGKPVAVKGVDASVMLLSASGKVDVSLAPAGQNKLEAKGNFNVAAGTKAVATVTLPGEPVVNAKFTLK